VSGAHDLVPDEPQRPAAADAHDSRLDTRVNPRSADPDGDEDGDGDGDDPALPDEHGERPQQSGSSTRVLHLRELGAEFPDHPRRAPARVGPYKIKRRLGRGGMGTVYLAEPAASCPVPMGRMVAIKILHRTDAEERRRFAREAAYLQSLRHPGIVRVLDVGEHLGLPFLVMQLIDGKRLDDLVLKAPLDQRVAAEMAVQALEALHVAHLAGILHRDIKPGNIMVDRTGTVRLLDFGLASHMHHESRLTGTGNVVGTPAYMSPEQASGDREGVSRRSDIYGMGACLYELVTAVQPYTADNSVAMLRRIIDDPLVEPSRLRPSLERDLETVILVAMAKDPRDRYGSAEAMASDLRLFLQGKRIKARRLARSKLVMRATWRHRSTISTLALAAFLAFSALGVGIAHYLRVSREQADETPQQNHDVWKVLKRIDGPLEQAKEVHLAAYGPLGPDVQLATLPLLDGSARLSATVTLLETDAKIELFVNDRDVAQGYRLRLEGSELGDALVLMKDDRVLRRLALHRLHRDRPWRLSLEREDTGSGTVLTCRLNEEAPLTFRDLEPIEGTDACNTYIAYNPRQAAVRQVLLEHSTHTVANVLAAGIALQENGVYGKAITEFNSFLRDYPESPHAPEAQLRVAVCLESLKDYVHAKERFLDLANAGKQDREYRLTALFHAWSCCQSTNDYNTAESLFAQIRQEYNLPALVSSIPDDLLVQVLDTYFDRASTLSSTEPERAAGLYKTGIELAEYLNIAGKISQGRTGAGDILLGMGQLEEAKELYYAAAIDQSLSLDDRLKATLKVAEVERLLDHPDVSEGKYQSVLSSPLKGDPPQLARLYLGDLYLQQGERSRALELWKASPEAVSLPGEIMAHLVSGKGPLPTTSDPWYLNDVEYFTARLSLLSGQTAHYRDDLREVVRIGPAYDWPTPLAKHLLELPLPAAGPDAAPVPTSPAGVTAPTPATPSATPTSGVPIPAVPSVPAAISLPAVAPAAPPAAAATTSAGTTAPASAPTP